MRCARARWDGDERTRDTKAVVDVVLRLSACLRVLLVRVNRDSVGIAEVIADTFGNYRDVTSHNKNWPSSVTRGERGGSKVIRYEFTLHYKWRLMAISCNPGSRMCSMILRLLSKSTSCPKAST